MSKAISFAWTTPALVAGRKTCTCRDWDDDYAQRFRAGDVIAAYDRSPRYGGTQIATLRLTHDATYGRLIDVLGGFDAAYEAEGFAYGDEQVASGNQQMRKAIERNLGVEPGETLRDWLRQTAMVREWIVRFEVVDEVPG